MGRFISLVVGGAIGAAAAFLFTPRNGAENRAKLAEMLESYGAQVPTEIQEAASNALGSAATGSTKVINVVIDKSDEAVKSVKSAVSGAKPGIVVEEVPSVQTESADDLREKIDAARERIATQIAQNAEAMQDAAVDKIPEVVDAVGDAKKNASEAVENAKESLADTAASLKEKIVGAANEDAK